MAAVGEPVTIEVIDSIAILRLSEGESRLNPSFIRSFSNALDAVERNSSIVALVSTSSGKFYSNGMDLKWISNANKQEVLNFCASFNKLLTRLAVFPMPTIAAINGHAFAGGLMLCLAHDYRVMRSRRGWVCLNEVRLDMVFSLSIEPSVSNLISGVVSAKIPGSTYTDAMVFGKRFTSEEARSAGIVHEVCEIDQLQQRAMSMAKKVVGGQPFNRISVAALKKAVYAQIVEALDQYEQSTQQSPLSHHKARL